MLTVVEPSIRMIVKGDTGQSPLDEIKTFGMNEILLEENNLPAEDDPLEVGSIEHTHARENSFFGFLWTSLMSGIISLLIDPIL